LVATACAVTHESCYGISNVTTHHHQAVGPRGAKQTDRRQTAVSRQHMQAADSRHVNSQTGESRHADSRQQIADSRQQIAASRQADSRQQTADGR
jgi:hypothetical protein